MVSDSLLFQIIRSLAKFTLQAGMVYQISPGKQKVQPIPEAKNEEINGGSDGSISPTDSIISDIESNTSWMVGFLPFSKYTKCVEIEIRC